MSNDPCGEGAQVTACAPEWEGLDMFLVLDQCKWICLKSTVKRVNDNSRCGVTIVDFL